MQTETPLTDQLRRRLAEYQSRHNTNANNNNMHNTSELLHTSDSNTSSAQISPRGVASHHHEPRAGSIEADPCGWIEGTAVTNGSTDLDHDAHGVKTDGPAGIQPLRKVGGGLFSLSYTGRNANDYRSGSQDVTSASGYSQPTFTSNNNFNTINNSYTSGVNSTPREGLGYNNRPPLGARYGNDGNYASAMMNNNNDDGNGMAFASGNSRGLNNNRAGGVSSPPMSGAWRRNVPQPGEVDPDARQYDGDQLTDDGLNDDDENYEDDEEEEEEEDEFGEEADVMPRRYRPEVTTGPLAANGKRGLAHPMEIADDQQRNELERKAEFESFNVVASLLSANGADGRRDLLDYHTPYPFLQFLEQLMCGAYFIRFYPRHGTPHERYIYLRMIEVEPGVERPFFCQCKHATAVQIDDAVPVSDLVGIVAGDDAPAFRRQKVAEGFVKGSFVGARRPSFSTKGALSLYFWDRKRQQPRSMDILTTNMAVFKLWKITVDALVSVNTVKVGVNSHSEVQAMRGYFLAAQRAVQEAAKASGMVYNSK